LRLGLALSLLGLLASIGWAWGLVVRARRQSG
jgi:hypothetical protein